MQELLRASCRGHSFHLFPAVCWTWNARNWAEDVLIIQIGALLLTMLLCGSFYLESFPNAWKQWSKELGSCHVDALGWIKCRPLKPNSFVHQEHSNQSLQTLFVSPTVSWDGGSTMEKKGLGDTCQLHTFKFVFISTYGIFNNGTGGENLAVDRHFARNGMLIIAII